MYQIINLTTFTAYNQDFATREDAEVVRNKLVEQYPAMDKDIVVMEAC